MAENGAGHGRRNLLIVIALILTGWALRATGSFMVPVVFSVILALLIAPIDRWVSQRMPAKLEWLGHVASMGVILLVLAAFAGAMWFAAQQTMARFPGESGDGSLLPQWGEELLPGSDGPGATASPATGSTETNEGGGVSQLGEYLSGMGGSLIQRLGQWATGFAAQILSMAGATLSAIVLVFFLTLIMMIEGTKWRLKVGAIMDASAREEALDSISIIADRLRRYLLARVVLGIVTAALYAGWLWIFGIDLLIVWSLIVFLLGFIPTFGSLIAGVLPVIYAFVQKDFSTAMAAGVGLLVIEQVMGNYVDPRVQGRQVSLSTLVILITLLIWTWIWGVAGAILAVPITIAAMIICAHVPRLRPFALLLSDATSFVQLDRQTSSSDH